MKGIVVSHRGYMAVAVCSQDDGYYYGKQEGIAALGTFGGETIEEVQEDYRNLIDDYIDYSAHGQGWNRTLSMDLGDNGPVMLEYVEA